MDLDDEELEVTRKMNRTDNNINEKIKRQTENAIRYYKNLKNIEEVPIDILRAMYIDVLAEQEQDKKRIKELEDNLYSANCIIEELIDNIPVQKIKDKIEEIKEDKDSKYYYMFLADRDIENTINILEELLEDK